MIGSCAVPLLLAGALVAASDSPDARLAALEAEVADLVARHAAAATAFAEAATLDAMLADARLRAGLADDPLRAGWDRGFFVGSADGTFRLAMEGQVQVQAVANHREGDVADADRFGFELRRLKIRFRGHALDPRLGYAISGSFDRGGDGAFELSDAFATWELDAGVTIRAGRYRPWFLREEVVSSKRLLFSDRSLVARRFGNDRATGVDLGIERDRWRLRGGFQTIGATLDETADPGTRASLRGDLLLAGAFGALRDMSSFVGDDPAAALGLALQHRHDDPGDRAGATEWVVTADATVDLGGASLLVAWTQAFGDDGSPWGLAIQGGWFLAPGWELAARGLYGEGAGAGGRLTTATVGVNRYVDGHRLKIGVEVGYGIEGVDATWASSSAGWLEDAPGERGQLVAIAQVQLLF